MDSVKEPFLVKSGYIKDERGVVGVLHDNQLPFKILRTFWLYQVPENTRRGGHAHRTSQQVLICVDGLIEVDLEHLTGRTYRFNLYPSEYGLYLPPLCWGYYTFRQQAKAFCLASDHYQEKDYIRDYQEFLTLKDANQHN